MRIESYTSNHARTGARQWWRVVDASGRTIKGGFHDRRSAERFVEQRSEQDEPDGGVHPTGDGGSHGVND